MMLVFILCFMWVCIVFNFVLVICFLICLRSVDYRLLWLLFVSVIVVICIDFLYVMCCCVLFVIKWDLFLCFGEFDVYLYFCVFVGVGCLCYCVVGWLCVIVVVILGWLGWVGDCCMYGFVVWDLWFVWWW